MPQTLWRAENKGKPSYLQNSLAGRPKDKYPERRENGKAVSGENSSEGIGKTGGAKR